MNFAANSKKAGSFEPHELCYVDFYSHSRTVRREIIFDTIRFCGKDYEGVQVCHSDIRSTYRAPLVNYFKYNPFEEYRVATPLADNVWERRITTAWPFLKIVRPDDTEDGLGIEYRGERIWDMFWTPEDRIEASPRRCPDTAIAMREAAVTVSPDGYLLACVYSRDDSDMREEPEMYVWDLRPLVRDLLWDSRRDFVMFLAGCKYLAFRGRESGVKEASETSGIVQWVSAISLGGQCVLPSSDCQSQEKDPQQSMSCAQQGQGQCERKLEVDTAVNNASVHVLCTADHPVSSSSLGTCTCGAINSVFSSVELTKYIAQFI